MIERATRENSVADALRAKICESSPLLFHPTTKQYTLYSVSAPLDSSVNLPSKRWLQHLKVARAASAQSFKKRKVEACSIPDPAELEIDGKLSTIDTIDTSDTESQSGVWYWNESANESDSDSEVESDSDSEVEKDKEKEEDVEEPDREIEQPRIETPKMVLEWNQEGENKLRGGYGKGSQSTTTRKNKSVRQSGKQALESYSLGALWQGGIDLGTWRVVGDLHTRS